MHSKCPVLLREAIEEYLLDLHIRNKSTNTICERRRVLNCIVIYAEQNGWPEGLSQIETSQMRRFFGAIKGRPKKARTPGQATEPISDSYFADHFRWSQTLFNWAVKQGMLAISPMDGMSKPRVTQKVIPTLSTEDIESLFREVDRGKDSSSMSKFLAVRNRAALHLLADTPIRRGELLGLRPQDLNLAEQRVLVTGKGAKQRHMWYGSGTTEALREYLEHRKRRSPASSALWIDFQGRPCGDGWIRKWLETIGQRAGIPGLHPHRFRHTWTMKAIEADINERTICRIAGWVRLPETYVATLGDRQARAAQLKVSPVDRMANGESLQGQA